MADNKEGMSSRELQQSQSGDGETAQSRGERFDEAQGGGRGPDSVSRADDEIAADEHAH